MVDDLGDKYATCADCRISGWGFGREFTLKAERQRRAEVVGSGSGNKATGSPGCGQPRVKERDRGRGP